MNTVWLELMAKAASEKTAAAKVAWEAAREEERMAWKAAANAAKQEAKMVWKQMWKALFRRTNTP